MINYLKSSISISSFDGCTIGCKYCILSVLENRGQVRKVEEERELVEKLLALKLYTAEIPISVNNQTDPFLNKEVFQSTMKILEIMEEKQVKNPILIITKGYLNAKQIEALKKVELNLIVLYTFSGLSEKLENRKEALQIKTLEQLSKLKNIKLLNYYRPVIEGLNTDEETIKKVVKVVTKYCKGSIVSGIRINSFLKNTLYQNKIELPEQYDPDHKVLLPETYEKIKQIFANKNEKYPIFKKTSCGVSYITKKPDYNGHSARIYYCDPSCVSYPICISSHKIGFCDDSCANFKRCKKESEKVITEKYFKTLLEKIDKQENKFEIGEHYIKLEGTYWQEEVSYLRHVTKRNIKVDKTLKREDEKLISK